MAGTRIPKRNASGTVRGWLCGTRTHNTRTHTQHTHNTRTHTQSQRPAKRTTAGSKHPLHHHHHHHHHHASPRSQPQHNRNRHLNQTPTHHEGLTDCTPASHSTCVSRIYYYPQWNGTYCLIIIIFIAFRQVSFLHLLQNSPRSVFIKD